MQETIFPLWPRLTRWAKQSFWRSLCILGFFMVASSAFVGALIVPYGHPLHAALLCAVISIAPTICIVAAVYYCRAARLGVLAKSSSLGRLSIAFLVGIPISGIILWLLHILSEAFFPSHEILGGESGMIIFMAPLLAFWIALPTFLISAIYIWRTKIHYPADALKKSVP